MDLLTDKKSASWLRMFLVGAGTKRANRTIALLLVSIALVVGALLAFLLGRFVGQRASTPDLTVRVWVGAAHYRTLVLEYLHPAIALAQFRRLGRPHIHHDANLLDGHLWQGQVVARGEADHAAGAPLAFGTEERMRRGG